ncbi:hypothetical protein [Nostoc sp. PCC 7524]|uniref:hypothetical protein n=1 Tax=Nostoc sp. (strain ATCC 29411 / PCC 7524) TaxID=28072 RepID=UPI00149452A1|nr:hypothetical protein [Nostoc sp. PCC 7524]
MSNQMIASDLIMPLSTDEQQLLSGGQQRSFGGGRDDDRFDRRCFRFRRCVRRCFRFS